MHIIRGGHAANSSEKPRPLHRYIITTASGLGLQSNSASDPQPVISVDSSKPTQADSQHAIGTSGRTTVPPFAGAAGVGNQLDGVDLNLSSSIEDSCFQSQKDAVRIENTVRHFKITAFGK